MKKNLVTIIIILAMLLTFALTVYANKSGIVV